MSGSNSSNPAGAPGPDGEHALDLTVHGVGLGQAGVRAADDGARTRRGRLRMLMVLLVCASPVIASYFTYFVIRPQGRTNYGELVQPSRTLPGDLQLTTLDGQAVAPASLRGQWLLVTVGPSDCDAACDRRLFTQRQLREMLGRERERLDKVWLVTDAGPLAPALQQAVSAAPPLMVLRADGAAVQRWLAPAAGQDLTPHLFLVDPMGEWMMRFPADPDPAKVKRDLERLLRASASWDRAGRTP